MVVENLSINIQSTSDEDRREICFRMASEIYQAYGSSDIVVCFVYWLSKNILSCDDWAKELTGSHTAINRANMISRYQQNMIMDISKDGVLKPMSEIVLLDPNETQDLFENNKSFKRITGHIDGMKSILIMSNSFPKHCVPSYVDLNMSHTRGSKSSSLLDAIMIVADVMLREISEREFELLETISGVDKIILDDAISAFKLTSGKQENRLMQGLPTSCDSCFRSHQSEYSIVDTVQENNLRRTFLGKFSNDQSKVNDIVDLTSDMDSKIHLTLIIGGMVLIGLGLALSAWRA